MLKAVGLDKRLVYIVNLFGVFKIIIV